MSTLELPLRRPRLGPVRLPRPATLPVSDTLQSIARDYTLVYWYNMQDPGRRVEAVCPEHLWVNDLDSLQFGESY